MTVKITIAPTVSAARAPDFVTSLLPAGVSYPLTYDRRMRGDAPRDETRSGVAAETRVSIRLKGKSPPRQIHQISPTSGSLLLAITPY